MPILKNKQPGSVLTRSAEEVKRYRLYKKIIPPILGLITLVLIWGLGWALKRTLGGQTGDTLGAAIELGELLFLLALL